MNEKIIKAWNDNADEFNQWDNLSLEEQNLFSKGFNLGIKYNETQKRRLIEKNRFCNYNELIIQEKK